MGENYFSCHWELQLPGEALPLPIGRKKEPGETCKNRRQGSGMMLLVLRGKKQVRISRFKFNYETLIMSVKNKFDRKLNIKVVLLSNILTMLRKILLIGGLHYIPFQQCKFSPAQHRWSHCCSC